MIPGAGESYQALVEVLGVAVLRIDAEGRITNSNRAFARAFGWNEEQLRGRVFHEIVERGPDDQVLAIKRSDGTRALVGSRTVSLGEAGGALVGFSEQHTDQEAMYRGLVESVPAYSYLASADDSRTLYRSPQAEAMLGYSLVDWAADPDMWEHILHPEDHDRVMDEFLTSAASDHNFRSEYRVITKSGQVRWMRDHAAAVPNVWGTGKIVQGVVLDITEQREAELVARRSQEQLDMLLRTAPVILCSVAPDGLVTVAAGRGFSDLGIVPSGVINRSVYELFEGEPWLLEKLRLAITGAEVSEEFYSNAFKRWLDLSATPAFEDGHLVAVTIVATDVTARREAEKARLESEAKSRFLAAMSHELRTPLNSILGFSQLLQNEQSTGPLNDRQRRYVTNVLGSGRHLLELVTDLLDLAKVQSGQADLESSPVDVADAVEKALVVIRPLAEKKGLSLATVATAGLQVRADDRVLHQVLLNLLANAVKFTDTGTINVAARSEPAGSVSIDVADTGIGIMPEAMAAIFGEFVQVQNGRTRPYEGTGLGLALARRFVQAMGGTVAATSEPGRGSVFTIVLPAA